MSRFCLRSSILNARPHLAPPEPSLSTPAPHSELITTPTLTHTSLHSRVRSRLFYVLNVDTKRTDFDISVNYRLLTSLCTSSSVSLQHVSSSGPSLSAPVFAPETACVRCVCPVHSSWYRKSTIQIIILNTCQGTVIASLPHCSPNQAITASTHRIQSALFNFC